MNEHCTFLRAGDISAIVGDDTERGMGGQQYSGLWSLLHKSCPASPFQAAYAGLIAGAHRGTSPILERLDETSARLHRPPRDKAPYAVTGTYRLVEPHYVDYTYAVAFAADAKDIPNLVRHSWCSYMNSPRDVSIHFIENNVWTTLTPVLHGEAATVFPSGLDEAHRCDWEKRTGEARFHDQHGFDQSFSGKTFDYPFYFGLLHGMIYLLMADHHRDFRFFISPSGAGYSAVPGQFSPAWDFAWCIWDAKPGETRALNIRLAWLPQAEFTQAGKIWREWEIFRELHPTR
jgi:hypothetical protein